MYLNTFYNKIMISKEKSFEKISEEIVKDHLILIALIQDIQKCTGPLDYLNELNADGRNKIRILRSNIDQLVIIAEFEYNKKKKINFLTDIDKYKEQLSRAIIAFRKANVDSAWAIEKLSRQSLLSLNESNLLRKRNDESSTIKVSSQLTDKLLDISKYLADTTKRSAETLDTLVISSDKVYNTRKELEDQYQVIVQSGKLLGKYSRREITDKALLIIAFMFFFACVLYIIQKRIF